MVEQLFKEHQSRSFGRAHILRSLAALLLGQVARIAWNLDQSDTAPAGEPLVIQFEELLEEHFREHRSVSDYAADLSVSATHLSRMLRQATGYSASRIIEDRVIREARRHLVFTNLRVSEVAYLLGYSDPAHFSRVFSKATGMSPREFRSRMACAT